MTNLSEQADYTSLRSNVSALGSLLGEIISDAEGADFLALVEQIRVLSRAAREGEESSSEKLVQILRELSNEQLVPVARAFNQFLNLANIADQHHSESREMDPLFSASGALASTFDNLIKEGVSAENLNTAILELKIELVLTAHPTEIMRRTLIHKHSEIGNCLNQLELSGLTNRERDQLNLRLRDLITQIWFGDDFRTSRPSPVDEAKWGYAVVEDSLWDAVPEFMRRLDSAYFDACGTHLPPDFTPVSFVSWMGGDRDGNPNVTAPITEEVLRLSRWQAADLYFNDLSKLAEELSMTKCDNALRTLAAQAHEPYRAVLRQLREKMRLTRAAIEDELDGEPVEHQEVFTDIAQLLTPLDTCYRSLHNCGMASVAEGALLDLLRKVRCFGLHLVRVDVRQDSARHTQALSELTQFLELGDYASWDEDEKQSFLLTELSNPRPLIPRRWQPSSDVAEVLATCEVVAKQPPEALGAYVISMARQASDILAVHLLLQESGCDARLPVSPLFETLDDLSRAKEVISRLLSLPWYRKTISGQLMVMIGYSDSAKDAGVLAASWAQYTAQESLLQVCDEQGVKLTLFHGRGGSIGRGGAPAHAALLSQPPGSLRNGLRVTEQGEMIRTKLGWTPLAVKTLALYTTAICRANLMTPPEPKAEWRALMEQMSTDSCTAYRAIVREEPDFVSYFRHATPEQELTKLPLGSRPARRNTGGGIESLRAIPWIFAWSQNRLMVPAWLGAGAAMQLALDNGAENTLQTMFRQWPFFEARISMLEMVYAKADSGLSTYYDNSLVPQEWQHIGNTLRSQLALDCSTVLAIAGRDELMDDQPWVKQSLQLRDIYTDPLNYLQAELLKRNRAQEEPFLEHAIMVTIAGIAAGMRNTG
ncbi:MAG: phosphoenolpyruvate carboxylase [Candidatus Azotimanducaceae bacterium]|jgi:phosphoenolpyruvate carboxylase